MARKTLQTFEHQGTSVCILAAPRDAMKRGNHFSGEGLARHWVILACVRTRVASVSS